MHSRFAVSNIAWSRHDDPVVLSLLKRYGVAGIEVAPTKIWPGWIGATPENAADYRDHLLAQGFQIPALQAILFGKPDLNVFDPLTHPAFLDHIKHVASLAQSLRARVLVFGAPKNRRRGEIPAQKAMEQASEFLGQLGEICLAHNCVLGIEPNPPAYQCDFVNTVSEAVDLVEMTGSPGVKLHLDSGATKMNTENLAEIIGQNSFVHYHISEPGLARIGTGEVDHKTALSALKDKGYDRWISVEMRQSEPEIQNLEDALSYLVWSMA